MPAPKFYIEIDSLWANSKSYWFGPYDLATANRLRDEALIDGNDHLTLPNDIKNTLRIYQPVNTTNAKKYGMKPENLLTSPFNSGKLPANTDELMGYVDYCNS